MEGSLAHTDATSSITKDVYDALSSRDVNRSRTFCPLNEVTSNAFN